MCARLENARSAVTAFCLAIAWFSVASTAQPVALVGGTLLADTTIENGVILIEGERITALGPQGSVAIDERFRRVDTAGKFIIPGLIDAHVHFFQSGGLYTRPDIIDLRHLRDYATQEVPATRALADDFLRRYLRCGVTAVADVGGPMSNFAVRALASQITFAPRVAVAGPLISTYQPEALTTLSPPILRAPTPEVARELVRQQAAHRPDFIKLWYLVRPGETAESHRATMSAAIEEAHSLGLRVAVHAAQVATARLAVELGTDMLVHLPIDEVVDDAFIGELREKEIVVIGTLMIWSRVESLRKGSLRLLPEEILLANPDVLSTLTDPAKLDPAALPKEFLESWRSRTPAAISETLQANALRLYQGGVTLAVGTDAGNPGPLHGPAIYAELAALSQARIPSQALLKMATQNGAAAIGNEELGALQSGMLADVLVLDADPRTDIMNVRKIAQVISRGQMKDIAALEEHEPEAVVQRQVNAYNLRNADAFAACYAENVRLHRFPTETYLEGREALHTRYAGNFERYPMLHAKIAGRIAAGSFVADEEQVSLAESEHVHALALYRVQDGLISDVWFISGEPGGIPDTAATTATAVQLLDRCTPGAIVRRFPEDVVNSEAVAAAEFFRGDFEIAPSPPLRADTFAIYLLNGPEGLLITHWDGGSIIALWQTGGQAY